MSTSDIITGRFVRIEQTTASVGDRIVARIIDMFVIVLYVVSVVYLLFGFLIDRLKEWDEGVVVFVIVLVMLPAVGYSFLLETFNRGRTVGKMVMKTRVVKADGSAPGMGDYLLRWMLLMIDWHFSCIGLLFIICTRDNRRLGDMAAGTLVIKQADYKSLRISLDEFEYARRNYTPVYPEAAQLSLRQSEIIGRVVNAAGRSNPQMTARLAEKVQTMLSVKRREPDDAAFLETILHDYQYYALELV